MKKEDRFKLFSVTKDDCEWQTLRSGGPGGQNQNKVSSGVRVIHRPSGAVGEARYPLSQLFNRREAFKRMANSPKFQRWARIHAAEVMGKIDPKEISMRVEEQMNAKNIKVEVGDGTKWFPEQETPEEG